MNKFDETIYVITNLFVTMVVFWGLPLVTVTIGTLQILATIDRIALVGR